MCYNTGEEVVGVQTKNIANPDIEVSRRIVSEWFCR